MSDECINKLQAIQELSKEVIEILINNNQLITSESEGTNSVIDIANHVKDTCGINKLEEDDESIHVSMDEDAYEKYLPSNLSMELVNAVKQYDSDFKLGVLIGVSEAVLPSLKEDDNIDTVIAHTNLPNDEILHTNIEINCDRQKMYIDFSQDVISNNLFDREKMENIKEYLTNKYFNELAD